MIGSVKKIRIKSKAQDSVNEKLVRLLERELDKLDYGPGVWLAPTLLRFEHLVNGKTHNVELNFYFRNETIMVEKFRGEAYERFTNDELRVFDNLGINIAESMIKVFNQHPEDWFNGVKPVSKYTTTITLSFNKDATEEDYILAAFMNLMKVYNAHWTATFANEIVIEGYGELESLRLFNEIKKNWVKYFHIGKVRVVGMKREVTKV